MEEENKLSHKDWCFLSRVFNNALGLSGDQVIRINEFLKREIEKALNKQNSNSQEEG